MYKTVDQKYTKFLLTFARKYCRNMTGIFTGYVQSGDGTRLQNDADRSR